MRELCGGEILIVLEITQAYKLVKIYQNVCLNGYILSYIK